MTVPFLSDLGAMMRRGSRFAVLPLAAAFLAALAVLVPSTASALAQPGGYVFNLGLDEWLYAHAHGSHIQVTYSYPQDTQRWDAANFTTWVNPITHRTVTVYELELVPTNLCVNVSPSDYAMYLDSCVAGDKNELFRELQQSSYPGCNDVHFVAVQATEDFGSYAYMSATTNSNFSAVWALPPGSSAFQNWTYSPCPRPVTARLPAPTTPS